MDIHQAKQILENYRNGNASSQEKQLVEDWYARLVETGEWQWGEGEKEQLRRSMESRLLQRINAGSANEVRHIRSAKVVRWWWAAASVFALLTAGGYLFFFNKTDQPAAIVEQQPVQDVKAPDANRATITLSNGEVVYLDSAGNGMLATQNTVSIIKTADGKIGYRKLADDAQPLAEEYNTLFNPYGSKIIDMTLSDGSRLWLNAGSSATYPVAFTGHDRRVKITGEAYFEVAHDKAKPFYVIKDQMEVRVLGTKFNVNAYDDEDDIRVTLLEGSVMAGSAAGSVMIKPGQQALVAPGRKPQVLRDIDMDLVMAWKNGLFSFDNADLSAVMRQLSRWYNVEVVYEGKIPEGRFEGKIPRDLTFAQILNGLTSTRIHFRVEANNRIVILPE